MISPSAIGCSLDWFKSLKDKLQILILHETRLFPLNRRVGVLVGGGMGGCVGGLRWGVAGRMRFEVGPSPAILNIRTYSGIMTYLVCCPFRVISRKQNGPYRVCITRVRHAD